MLDKDTKKRAFNLVLKSYIAFAVALVSLAILSVDVLLATIIGACLFIISIVLCIVYFVYILVWSALRIKGIIKKGDNTVKTLLAMVGIDIIGAVPSGILFYMMYIFVINVAMKA